MAESKDGSHDADDLEARLPDPHKKEYSRSNVANDKHRCDDDVTGCVGDQPSTNRTSQAGGHAPNYDRHTHKLNSNTLCDVHLYIGKKKCRECKVNSKCEQHINAWSIYRTVYIQWNLCNEDTADSIT